MNTAPYSVRPRTSLAAIVSFACVAGVFLFPSAACALPARLTKTVVERTFSARSETVPVPIREAEDDSLALRRRFPTTVSVERDGFSGVLPLIDVELTRRVERVPYLFERIVEEPADDNDISRFAAERTISTQDGPLDCSLSKVEFVPAVHRTMATAEGEHSIVDGYRAFLTYRGVGMRDELVAYDATGVYAGVLATYPDDPPSDEVVAQHEDRDERSGPNLETVEETTSLSSALPAISSTLKTPPPGPEVGAAEGTDPPAKHPYPAAASLAALVVASVVALLLYRTRDWHLQDEPSPIGPTLELARIGALLVVLGCVAWLAVPLVSGRWG